MARHVFGQTLAEAQYGAASPEVSATTNQTTIIVTLLRYSAAPTLDSADAARKEVLKGALKQVGFIPNMYASMVNAPGVLTTCLHGYAAFRQKPGLTPTEREVIFLAISQQNGCNYRTAAHSMLADKMSGVPAPVLAAIRSGQPIPDGKLQALYRFARDWRARPASPARRSPTPFLPRVTPRPRRFR